MTRRRWWILLSTLVMVVLVAGIGEFVRGVLLERELNAAPVNAAKFVRRASELLTDRNFMVRAAACRALTRLGSNAQPAIPAVRLLLADGNSMVRRDAAGALGNIGGPEAENAVPELTALLNDDDWQVRWTAAVALGRFGAKSNTAVDRLMDLVEDEQMGLWAAQALSKIGVAATGAVPRIHARLKTASGLARAEYVAALGRFGPAAAVAFTDIEALTADPDPTVSSTAKTALKAIRP